MTDKKILYVGQREAHKGIFSKLNSIFTIKKSVLSEGSVGSFLNHKSKVLHSQKRIEVHISLLGQT